MMKKTLHFIFILSTVFLVATSTNMGINHWGGFYQINPSRDQLRDGAEFLKLITPPIKIYLGPNTPYLGIDEPLITFEHGQISLHDSISFVLENFDTVTLITFNPDKINWKDGFDQDEWDQEVEFFSALTEYLYENYGNQKKTIFIQNWESDNAIGELTDSNIENMKNWIRARWTGVSKARRQSKLKILCGMELNHVIGWKNDDDGGMINHIYDVEMDFVSYSFYEWKKKNVTEGVENLMNGVEKIRENFQQITPIGLEVLGEQKCYVGEFGAGNVTVDVEFVPAVESLLSGMGVRYGFFWNVFNNEEGKEFYLVSPDLSLSPVVQSLF